MDFAINDVITLESNEEYLILDTTTIENEKYLYTVLIDEDEIPTMNYKYFEVIEEEDGNYIEEVEDKKLLEKLVTIFTVDYFADTIEENEEQED